jgi:hypothetical protein
MPWQSGILTGKIVSGMKIIYTKHALERVGKRSLSKTSIEATIAHHDQRWQQGDGSVKFIKQQGTRRYHVVANFLPQKRAWLVISAWVRGEEDRNVLWEALTWPWRLVRWLFGGH